MYGTERRYRGLWKSEEDEGWYWDGDDVERGERALIEETRLEDVMGRDEGKK
jgi:hypothetical protein